jgi:hypothetical protein
MNLKYQGTIKHTRIRDMFNAGITAGWETEEFDYLVYITFFGREWSWYIYR